MGCHNAAQVEDMQKKSEGLELRDTDIRALREAAAVAASEHETLQADIVDRKAEIENLEEQVCLSIPRLDSSCIRLTACMHHHACDAWSAEDACLLLNHVLLVACRFWS